MNETLRTIQRRSSIRGYENKKVDDKDIQLIINAGLSAPTATNRQELFFSVVDGNSALIDELETEKCLLRGIEKKENNSFYNAPTVIMISAEDDFKWSALDAGIAVQTMALAATSLSLGNLIVGSVADAINGKKKSYFCEKFGIPEGYSFQIAIAIGYGNVTKEPHTFDEEKQVKIIEVE